MLEEEQDLFQHIEDWLTTGEQEMFTVGTKVIRKSDVSSAAQLFGKVTQHINAKKVRVFWEYSRQHSTINISALKEVTPELEQELEAKAKADHEARCIEWEAEHIYLCNNVNPLARISNDGHKKPMRLSLGQTVNKEGQFCWYCKHPVILREQA